MNIFGKKTILRAIEPADKSLLLELINDPNIERMLGGNSYPVSEDSQAKWIADQVSNNEVLRCIVADMNTPEQGIGTVILSDIDQKNGIAQIHVKLSTTCQRKGYGTDAVKALVDYAFKQMRLHCVYAYVLSYNEPSQKLFLKCGFRKEGVLRDRVYKDGKYINAISYSVLNDEI